MIHYTDLIPRQLPFCQWLGPLTGQTEQGQWFDTGCIYVNGLFNQFETLVEAEHFPILISKMYH